jgi:hypothetical protein
LIAGDLLDLDCIYGMQNLVNTGLKNQNLDFKEVNSSDRLTWDGYCEAIMRVRIYRAQGQMSQHLADGCEYLWDCNVGGRKCIKHSSVQTARSGGQEVAHWLSSDRHTDLVHPGQSEQPR